MRTPKDSTLGLRLGFAALLNFVCFIAIDFQCKILKQKRGQLIFSSTFVAGYCSACPDLIRWRYPVVVAQPAVILLEVT